MGDAEERRPLALAAQHFDVFVTVDQNLASQQNLTRLSIAVVVLRAKTNRLADLIVAGSRPPRRHRPYTAGVVNIVDR